MGRKRVPAPPEIVQKMLASWPVTLRVFQIAVGDLAGATRKEVSESADTSAKTIYKDSVYYESVINDIKDVLAPVIKVNKREIRQVALENVEKELEAMLGTGLAAIQDALTSGNPELAAEQGWKLIRQLRGNPETPVNLRGRIQHAHAHAHFQMSEATLAALEDDVEADRDLMRAAKRLEAGQVIDVTAVH